VVGFDYRDGDAVGYLASSYRGMPEPDLGVGHLI